MKKINVCLVLLFVSACAYAQKQFVVDENAELRQVDKSFDAIKVSGGLNIYLSQSDKEEIAVSASDEKDKAGIKTVVENNVLKIYYDGARSWRKNRKMTVYVSFINIDNIDAGGASDITVAGTIKDSALKLRLSGASDLKADVAVSSLQMDLSGASDVNISGTATNFNIVSSGASDVKGFNLTTENCTAKASGASDISITVNRELSAEASGASNIFYKGNGVIKNIQSSGASTVTKKD